MLPEFAPFGRLVVATLLLFVPAACAQDRAAANIAPTEPLSAAEQLKRFTVPAGFQVQLVAAEPDIRKPINLNFDHRGRLFVTQSIEYPYAAQESSPKRDEVRIFSEFADNGRAGQITTFVGGLNIPIGVTPLADGALVYSIPNVYRCYDADGDGRAERREVLYPGFGFQDTHGMCSSLTRWIDGWIYACHGFSNISNVGGKDGQAIAMQSGNTFRLRADGSHVEYFTHGQVNPFGLCFDPLGNLYSADCHSKPVYMLLRGGYYPSFGKPDDGLGYAPEMIRHNHGSTGIAGVTYYAAGHFPPEYRDTLFIGNPITHRINHDRLETHGSTLRAIEQPDFLSCDDPWFRPVDVRLGPDGALYIADFYNRIIGHYEVPLDHPGRDRERGRIWRIVYTGANGDTPPPRMTDVTRFDLAGLLSALKSENLVVRTHATNELVERIGEPAAAELRLLLLGASTPIQRAHGLWALERLGGLSAEVVAKLAADADRLVRVHLLKALAERAAWTGVDEPLFALVQKRLEDDDATVRRAAADALARHPRFENVQPLLALWSSTPADDTHLIHAVRMALRDQLLAEGILDRLARQTAPPADRQRLTEVCLGARNEASARFVLDSLKAIDGQEPRVAASLHFAARYLAEAELPAMYRLVATAPWTDRPDTLRALHRAAQERGQPLPDDVRARAERLAERRLKAATESSVQVGLELIRDLRLAALHGSAAPHVDRQTSFEGLRPTAIDACVAADGTATTPLVAALLADTSEPHAMRQKAAQALAGINSEASRAALAATLRTVPGRLSIDVAAGLASNKAGAELLLSAIGEGKASAQLLTEPPVVNRLRLTQTPDLNERIARLTAGLPPRDERLRQLIEQRRKDFAAVEPDLVLGQKLFEKTCAACHRIGGKGVKIGPELDGIGQRGLERLLEDVVDPSRNVDQAFRSTVLTTTDGRALSGLALREEGQVLVLADALGKELRVPLAEISERAVTPLSPMPANAVELVKEPEFYHLLGYLLSQRQAPAK